MNRIEKEYETFKKIVTNPYLCTNTSKLSIIYTMVCNAEKDAKYKSELEAFKAPETNVSFWEEIETFFREYNNSHGVDIRLALTPFDNPDYPYGLYFDVKTYKRQGDKLTEYSPIEYKVGEEAIFRATVYDQVTDKEITVPVISYTILSEDGNETTGEVKDSSWIEFSATCHRPGSVMATVSALDDTGKLISGCERAYPGAVFDFTDMKTTFSTPTDLEAFWREEIDKMKKVSPTDTTVTPYNGRVAHAFNVTETNYYHITKIDKDYLALLRSKHISTASDDILDTHDLWEFSLKCPGPCPTTGYVSVPKGKAPHSLPFRHIYAGYGAHSPRPFIYDDAISVYSTHHGYPCALSDEECYNELNGEGILGSYCKGNGRPNSDFDDIHDCYGLYIHLRNLQALRFFANPELSKDLPQVAQMWNGEVEYTGGSLGGYQVIGMCALTQFLDEKIKIIRGVATVPALCNYGGTTDNRLHSTFNIKWTKNAEYFDSAHLATLIDCPMLIDRLGLGDSICISSGICMAFNNFKGKKELRFLQNSSHGYTPKAEKQLWYKFSIDK